MLNFSTAVLFITCIFHCDCFSTVSQHYDEALRSRQRYFISADNDHQKVESRRRDDICPHARQRGVATLMLNAKEGDAINETCLAESYPNYVNLEVVLFGVGDMRVSDHEGLLNALSACNTTSKGQGQNYATQTYWVPLFILESGNTLPNLPQSSSMLLDSASLLRICIRSVDQELRNKFSSSSSNATGLNVLIGNAGEGMEDCMVRAVIEVLDHLDQICQQEFVCEGVGIEAGESTMAETIEGYNSCCPSKLLRINISVHVCNLGDADNMIGYGPYSILQHFDWNSYLSRHDDIALNRISNVQIKPWECNLRLKPFEDLTFHTEDRVDMFPDRYPDYVRRYDTLRTDALPPVQMPCHETAMRPLNVPSMSKLPSLECATSCLLHAHNIDSPNSKQLAEMRLEQNTGLYLTHWGGLPIGSISEREVNSCLRTFCIDSGESDAQFLQSSYWRHLERLGRGANSHSLEHASMEWLMYGASPKHTEKDGSGKDIINCNEENLIKGEMLVRFLAAPLMFGTVSVRQVWHWSHKPSRSSFYSYHLGFASRKKRSVLRKMVEAREWHRLLAAKNIRQRLSTYASNSNKDTADWACRTEVGYWRWHGFLCRYEIYKPVWGSNIINEKESNGKFGMLLIHGFGARGRQWKNTTSAVFDKLQSSLKTLEVLAPDLIGYGQSEKPQITYTQYLWEAHVTSLIKEICMRLGWNGFVLGGNSVGGYTAMATSADDSLLMSSNCSPISAFASSSGSFGSGKCKGLVLINTSGPIFNKEQKSRRKSDEIRPNSAFKPSVAERVINGLVGDRRLLKRETIECIGKFLFFIMISLEHWLPSLGKIFYRANPDVMNKEYFDDIFRDSMDPGVINIVVSISKLLPKRPAQELLAIDSHSNANSFRDGKWLGPTLIVQGYLDPLNAKRRAKKLVSLRNGITLTPMEAGHCPHDELPEEVGETIVSWLSDSADI